METPVSGINFVGYYGRKDEYHRPVCALHLILVQQHLPFLNFTVVQNFLRQIANDNSTVGANSSFSKNVFTIKSKKEGPLCTLVDIGNLCLMANWVWSVLIHCAQRPTKYCVGVFYLRHDYTRRHYDHLHGSLHIQHQTFRYHLRYGLPTLQENSEVSYSI